MTYRKTHLPVFRTEEVPNPEWCRFYDEQGYYPWCTAARRIHGRNDFCKYTPDVLAPGPRTPRAAQRLLQALREEKENVVCTYQPSFWTKFLRLFGWRKPSFRHVEVEERRSLIISYRSGLASTGNLVLEQHVYEKPRSHGQEEIEKARGEEHE